MAARRIRTENLATYNSSCQAEHEANILEQAEAIHRRRLERLGTVSDPMKAAEFFRSKYAHYDHEVFSAILLDNQHKIIRHVEFFSGTIDGAEIHVREIIKVCMQENASGIIASHNHPSGNLTPSNADRAVTARIKQGLAILEIRFLDHIIVSSEGTTSMAELGLM